MIIKNNPKNYINHDDPVIGKFFEDLVETHFCMTFESIIKADFEIRSVSQDQINPNLQSNFKYLFVGK